jgi:hypothetical protein
MILASVVELSFGDVFICTIQIIQHSVNWLILTTVAHLLRVWPKKEALGTKLFLK